jgi:tetratricopeptide (TPR) repeat protein
LDEERERLRELAQCYEMLSLLNLFGNKMAASVNAALETLRHAEALGPSAEYARALATMSLACSLVPVRPMADRYARKAHQVAADLKQEMTSSRVGELTAMYYMGDARWEEAKDSFTRAIEGFKVVGDKRRQIECTCLLSTWHHYKGNFARRVELGKEVFRLALSSGDLQAQAWGLLDQIESLLNLGDFGDVRELGQALRRHIGQNIYGADDIMAYGLLAALELRTGRFEEAVLCADKALAIMTKVTPTIVYNLESYAAVAEVYFTGWAGENGASFAERAKRHRLPDRTRAEHIHAIEPPFRPGPAWSRNEVDG